MQFRTIQIGEIIPELLEFPTFTDCETALSANKTETAFICSYTFGEIVISRKFAAARRPDSPEIGSVSDEFRLPSGNHSQIGVPASAVLGLESNPLFVVMKGYIELHRFCKLGDEVCSVPILVAETGDVFGEFEIRLFETTSDQAAWHEYSVDATAGIGTFQISTPQIFRKRSIQTAIGSLYAVKNESRWFASSIYESFRHFGIAFHLDLLVIPRPVVESLALHNPFLKQYCATLSSHLRTYQLLNPSFNERKPRLEDMQPYFAQKLVPAMIEGRLPVLRTCCVYDELQSWWQQYHSAVVATHKGSAQRNALHLPHHFFVPTTGQKGMHAFHPQEDPTGPVLSQAMLASLFHGSGVYEKQIRELPQLSQHMLVEGHRRQFNKLHFADLAHIRQRDWTALFPGFEPLDETKSTHMPGMYHLNAPDRRINWMLWIDHIGRDGDWARKHILDDCMIELIGDVKGKNVLDAGCGEGRLTRRLAELGAQATGVDVIPEFVNIAIQIAAKSVEPKFLRRWGWMDSIDTPSRQQRYRVCDITQIDDVEHYEVIVACCLLNEVADLDTAVDNLAKAAKPRGRCLVIVPDPSVVRSPPNGVQINAGGDIEFLEYISTKLTVINYWRTIERICEAFKRAGFNKLREVRPTAKIAGNNSVNEFRRLRGLPDPTITSWFVGIEFVKA